MAKSVVLIKHEDSPGAQTREEQDALAARHDDAQDAWFRDFLGRLFGQPDATN